MSISEIISGLAFLVSVVALVMEFRTRREVRKLTKLEIEKLEREKEQQSKAILYGYIEEDYFVIKNSGEAKASNVRYEGWRDWSEENKKCVIPYLLPYESHEVKLWKTIDSPLQSTFKITWDDESGKGHVWEETLNMYRD